MHNGKHVKTHWISPGIGLEFRSSSAALQFDRLCAGDEEEAFKKYIHERRGHERGFDVLGGRKAVENAKSNEQAAVPYDNADECYICYEGGDLVCCDYCPKSYHLNCHIPRLQANQLPKKWKCCECLAPEMEFMRCGECDGKLIVLLSSSENIIVTPFLIMIACFPRLSRV